MKLRVRFLWAGLQSESHLVVRFNIELDLLAGECADPKQRMNVSAKLSGDPRLGPTMMQLQAASPGWSHHSLDQHCGTVVAFAMVVKEV